MYNNGTSDNKNFGNEAGGVNVSPQAMAFFALAMMMVSACSSMKKEESWSSYYYGDYQQYRGRDNDSFYSRPAVGSYNAYPDSPRDGGMLDVRPMMRPTDGR